MLGREAPGDNPHVVAIEIQRARQADRVRRHRVGMPIMHHHAHRADAKRQIVRRDLQWPEPRPLLGDSRRGRYARGARWPDGIRFGEPLSQLLLQIGTIQKPPLLEKRAFHPPDQILDAAFLLGTIPAGGQNFRKGGGQNPRNPHTG